MYGYRGGTVTLHVDTGGGPGEVIGLGRLVSERLILCSTVLDLDPSTVDSPLLACFPDLVRDPATVQRRQPEGYACRRRWSHPSQDADVGVALLCIEDPQWSAPPQLPLTRWGYFTGGMDWISAVLGAPEPIPVEVNPQAWHRPGTWRLRTGTRGAPTGPRSLAGGAVLAGDLLIGVAVPAAPLDAAGTGEIAAIPVSTLVTLPGFQ